MFKWFNVLFDRVFAIVGAVVFLQAPQFFQQYAHRLAGHIDELKLHIAAFQQAAARNGKDLVEYIQKFLNQNDPDFAAQGNMMQMMLERHTALTDTLNALRDATPFSRPYYFLKNLNMDIFQATLKDFQPGLMITSEGLVYAFLGIGIGIFVYHALCFLLRRSVAVCRVVLSN